MNDLIRREDAINGKILIQLTNGVEIYSDEAVPVGYLKTLPSAEPKHGKWERKLIGKVTYSSAICSECGHEAIVDSYDKELLTKYCPNCGAKMEEE